MSLKPKKKEKTRKKSSGAKPAKRKERTRIASSGCGGFLNPPSHPEHKFCVEEIDYRALNRANYMDGDEVVGITRLSTAAKTAPMKTRKEAKALLSKWEKTKPSLGSAENQDWIHQVLGYFRNCYQSPDGSWNASNLVIDHDRSPLDNADTHAGVHLIRQYYSDYKPKPEHFADAYWGTKVERKWEKQKKTIEKGDVIRFQSSSLGRSNDWVYGVATGDGSGTKMDTIGGAIYVAFESYDPTHAIGRKNKEPSMGDKTKWSRDWGIEILKSVNE